MTDQYIRPNGTVNSAWANGEYTKINKVVTAPTAPNTATLAAAVESLGESNREQIWGCTRPNPGGRVQQLELQVYAKSNAGRINAPVTLYFGNTRELHESIVVEHGWAWCPAIWRGLDIAMAEFLAVEFGVNPGMMAHNEQLSIACAYVKIIS